MATEAQRRAVKNYEKKSVKQLKVVFYPTDHDLLEKIKEKGQAFGSIQGYVKDVLRRDIENGE